MKKILLLLLILINIKVSAQDCKVCTYSRFFWFDRARNVEFNESCPSTIVINTFFGPRTFTLTNEDDGGCSTLPIELSYFKANLVNYNVKLEWETLTEDNNDYFTIYKSYNGVNWGIVEELSGSGNSKSPIKYNLVDDGLKNGLVYYKLRQTDYNGQYEEFDIIYLDIKLDLTYKVYNLNGVEVNDDYKGVIIIKYSNGRFERKLNM